MMLASVEKERKFLRAVAYSKETGHKTIHYTDLGCKECKFISITN